MFSLSELLKIFHEKNFRPRKFWGQNFLIDKNIQQKILKNCEFSKDDIVLEIGPGLGQLTEDLLKKVKKVYAVEKDKLLCQLLKKQLDSYGNLEIINRDILKLSLPLKANKLKVVGNLPFYISSPILSYFIKNRRFIDSIYVTLQKEFAARIMAKPGTKDYSALSIFIQYYTKPAILFTIKRTCFYPQPEVDSCFMKLEIFKKSKVKLKKEKLFFRIVRAAFGKRRKTILNSLTQSRLNLSKENLIRIFKKARIEPQSRPESLNIEDFVRLAEVWYK